MLRKVMFFGTMFLVGNRSAWAMDDSNALNENLDALRRDMIEDYRLWVQGLNEREKEIMFVYKMLFSIKAPGMKEMGRDEHLKTGQALRAARTSDCLSIFLGTCEKLDELLVLAEKNTSEKREITEKIDELLAFAEGNISKKNTIIKKVSEKADGEKSEESLLELSDFEQISENQ